jgi:hypothetical protein
MPRYILPSLTLGRGTMRGRRHGVPLLLIPSPCSTCTLGKIRYFTLADVRPGTYYFVPSASGLHHFPNLLLTVGFVSAVMRFVRRFIIPLNLTFCPQCQDVVCRLCHRVAPTCISLHLCLFLTWIYPSSFHAPPVLLTPCCLVPNAGRPTPSCPKAHTRSSSPSLILTSTAHHPRLS